MKVPLTTIDHPERTPKARPVSNKARKKIESLETHLSWCSNAIKKVRRNQVIGAVVNDVIWCYMMLYDVIWCYMMLYDVIWCYMMLYDVIWCHMGIGTSESKMPTSDGSANVSAHVHVVLWFRSPDPRNKKTPPPHQTKLYSTIHGVGLSENGIPLHHHSKSNAWLSLSLLQLLCFDVFWGIPHHPGKYHCCQVAKITRPWQRRTDATCFPYTKVLSFWLDTGSWSHQYTSKDWRRISPQSGLGVEPNCVHWHLKPTILHTPCQTLRTEKQLMKSKWQPPSHASGWHVSSATSRCPWCCKRLGRVNSIRENARPRRIIIRVPGQENWKLPSMLFDVVCKFLSWRIFAKPQTEPIVLICLDHILVTLETIFALGAEKILVCKVLVGEL